MTTFSLIFMIRSQSGVLYVKSCQDSKNATPTTVSRREHDDLEIDIFAKLKTKEKKKETGFLLFLFCVSFPSFSLLFLLTPKNRPRVRHVPDEIRP